MTRRGTWFGAGVSILVLGAALAWAETPKTGAAKVVAPEQLTWGKAPPGLPTQIEATVLDGDPTQPGWFIVRLRMPDGAQIKPHWHPKDEHITVISGRFMMGMGDTWSTKQMKELPAGGYAAMPAGHRHFAMAHGETVVQVSAEGPFEITYVNPSDDPRAKRSSR
jgi:quercetin dioxygenase-like cupin family protein